MKVWVATYTHKHGSDITVYATEALALEARVQVAEQWWEHEMPDGEDKPADRNVMADRYFEIMDGRGREFYEIFETEVIQ